MRASSERATARPPRLKRRRTAGAVLRGATIDATSTINEAEPKAEPAGIAEEDELFVIVDMDDNLYAKMINASSINVVVCLFDNTECARYSCINPHVVVLLRARVECVVVYLSVCTSAFCRLCSLQTTLV